MAETKGNIQEINPATVTVDGEDMEVAPTAVTSVTTTVPHKADASSAPGPYDGLSVNRPPVSTNDPQTPIAHSLVAGAGAPTPPTDEERALVEGPHPIVAYVTAADKANVEPVDVGDTTTAKGAKDDK